MSTTSGSPPDPRAIDAFLDFLRRSEVRAELSFEDFLAEQDAALRDDLVRLLDEWERVTALLERLAPAASFSDHLRARYGDSVDPGISLGGDDPPSSASGAGGETIARLASEARALRYATRRELARGGMGKVLEVWDGDLRRRLAMKVVLGRKRPGADESEVDERRLSRFLEEAQITSQLDHPGIVPVHELGLDDRGRVYFTMQLVEGRDLRKVFELARAEREGWSRARVVSVLIRVCEAMAYAHAKGVVHRDLKPANVMVGRFGETYVMDWGLAKVLGRAEPEDAAGERDEESRVRTDRSDSASGDEHGGGVRTIDGDVVGTPAYMAPEQARGRTDRICPQTDVYALGAMLYELLAGQMPYEPLGEQAPAHVILDSVRRGPPWALTEIDPDLPSELIAICEKAMSREIEDRYADMMDLAEDLRAWLEHRTVAAYETGVLYEARKWVERNRPLAASLFAVLLVGIGSVVVFIAQQQRSLERLTAERENTQRENDRAEEAADRAETAALRAEEAAEAERFARRQMEDERDRANQSAVLAADNADLARARSYRALITTADYSLRLNEAMQAKRSLVLCEPELRGFEWRHLLLVADEDLEVLARFDEGVVLSAASAGGRWLLCVTADFRVHRIDTATGTAEPLDRLSASMMLGPVAASAAIDESGTLVATSVGGTFVRVRNVELDDELAAPELPAGATVTGLSFLPDGRRLLVTSLEAGSGRIRVHDLFGGGEVADYDGHAHPARCVVPRPRSTHVASGDDAGEVHVWDGDEGRRRLRLRGHHAGPVRCLAWSPDGSSLASGGEDGTIAVWDADDGRLRTIMRGHEGPVTALAFGGGGREVHSGGADATLRVWDARTGTARESLNGHQEAVTGVAAHGATGGLISTSLDGSVRRWDPKWRPGRLDVPLRGWDREWRQADSGVLSGLAFSPDGGVLGGVRSAGGWASYDAISGSPLTVRAPEAIADGEDVRVYDGGFFEPRLGLAGCCLSDGRVRVLDLAGDRAPLDLPTGERPAPEARLSPDGKRVAVGTRGGGLLVFDLATGALLLERAAHDRSVAHLAWSPDGGRIATVTRRELRVWKAADGAALGAWTKPHEMGINAVAFAPDGERVATASTDATVKLWRPGEVAPVGVLEGHEDAVMDVAFTDEEANRVVTASLDGTVRVWDAEACEILIAMRAPDEELVSVAIDSGERRVAACGSEGRMFVWDATPPEPRYARWSEARRIAGEADLVLDELERRLAWGDAIAAELRRDDELHDALREEALRRFELREADVVMLDRRLREVLCRGPLESGDAERALELSRRVLARSRDTPREQEARRLHGAALMRAGRVDEGFELLGGAEGGGEIARRILLPRTEGEVLRALFRGLALYQRGDEGAARDMLRFAEQSLDFLPIGSRTRLEPLRDEVREALGS